MSYLVSYTDYFYTQDGRVDSHVSVLLHEDPLMLEVECVSQHQPHVTLKVDETLGLFPNVKRSIYKEDNRVIVLVEGTDYKTLRNAFYETFSLDE